MQTTLPYATPPAPLTPADYRRASRIPIALASILLASLTTYWNLSLAFAYPATTIIRCGTARGQIQMNLTSTIPALIAFLLCAALTTGGPGLLPAVTRIAATLPLTIYLLTLHFILIY